MLHHLQENKGSYLLLAFSLIFSCILVLLVHTILQIDLSHTSPAAAVSGDISWQAFNGGGVDSGDNTSETLLNTGNVGNMTKLWKAVLPAVADSGVIEQANVSTSSGVHDLVFVNTIKGNLIAFDSVTGSKIWEADPSSANFNGQGTKSTPAIDPTGQYIYAYALDGKIHQYTITNGSEVTGNGFPATATLLPNNIEKASASLNIAGGYLYATISGNDGDYGHYVGHVVSVNLSSGVEHVWNSECSNITQLLDANSGDANYCANTESGIWARPGVVVDSVTGNVFVATGNGLYDANTGGVNYGDSIVELKPDLSQIVDAYTPTTYANLQSADADLGSTAPVILPKQNGSNTPYLLTQGGKDGMIRLVNRQDMSGHGGPGHTGGELQLINVGGEMHNQPAVWTDAQGTTWIFFCDEGSNFYAYKLQTVNGVTSLVHGYTIAGIGTTSPFVANGVVYVDGTILYALNPANGSILWKSNTANAGSVSISAHWQSPLLVNATLFTADNSGNLYAFAVPGVATTASPTPTQVQTQTPTQTSTATPTPSATSTLTHTTQPTAIHTPTPTTHSKSTPTPSVSVSMSVTMTQMQMSIIPTTISPTILHPALLPTSKPSGIFAGYSATTTLSFVVGFVLLVCALVVLLVFFPSRVQTLLKNIWRRIRGEK